MYDTHLERVLHLWYNYIVMQRYFKVIKVKNFFNKKIHTALSAVLVLLSVLIVVQTVFASSTLSAGESEKTAMASNINPNIAEIAGDENAIVLTTTEPVETTKKVESKKKATTAPTTAEPTTQEATIPFATAIPPQTPADYNAQWNAGYLVAIDNPDTTYECAQVTLSDYDRDLLERLCMGEFGSGGFVGAALIAQAVKNAICFDGYTSVQAVIDDCRYTGRTDIGTNEACKQAVRYIFDENHDAVQHRIMYMYNPYLVQSAFHESQNYILTYEDVRFFDRWGY